MITSVLLASTNVLCVCVCVCVQLSSRSHKTYRLKERVMLVHAWITDTVMAEGKIVDRGEILTRKH